MRFPHSNLLSAGEEEEETVAAVDPYELMEAVDILSKLPKDFYDKIVSVISSSVCSGHILPKSLSHELLNSILIANLNFCFCRKLKSGKRGKKLWKLLNLCQRTQNWRAGIMEISLERSRRYLVIKPIASMCCWGCAVSPWVTLVNTSHFKCPPHPTPTNFGSR